MLFLATLAVPHAATVGNPRCEYLVNPLGIDTVKPRFSWEIQVQSGKGTAPQSNSGESTETTPSTKATMTSDIPRGVMQTAYQILVASSPELLKNDKGDKWDSGKVDSDQSVNVAYQGKALASCEKCWWKVGMFPLHFFAGSSASQAR
ncbi:MAG: hypothetical protein NTV46_05035 [Verrucomicrobia bacterium]|nr:hypothetical protein [Verrucomicrobiota bacterium]